MRQECLVTHFCSSEMGVSTALPEAPLGPGRHTARGGVLPGGNSIAFWTWKLPQIVPKFGPASHEKFPTEWVAIQFTSFALKIAPRWHLDKQTTEDSKKQFLDSKLMAKLLTISGAVLGLKILVYVSCLGLISSQFFCKRAYHRV